MSVAKRVYNRFIFYLLSVVCAWNNDVHVAFDYVYF